MTCCDLRNRLLDRCRNLRIFMVDDARDFECGFGVKALRSLVLALGSQFLKQSGLVFLLSSRLGAGRLLHRRAGKHRVCPQVLIVSGNPASPETILDEWVPCEAEIGVAYSASRTALWNAGRTARMTWDLTVGPSAVGEQDDAMAASRSIHSEQPLKPRCPME